MQNYKLMIKKQQIVSFNQIYCKNETEKSE